MKIYLGKNKTLDEKVFWNIEEEINPHLLISGGSGSGKTETLKKIIFELKEKNLPSIIFDFHDDFRFLAENIIDTSNISIHPLEIEKGEKPLDVAYKFSDIVKNVFSNIGVKQQNTLREAIKDFFKSCDLDLKKVNDGSMKVKPFKEFKKFLYVDPLNFVENENMKAKDDSLLNKLSILFDFEVFSSEKNESQIPLENMTKDTTVLKLNNYPNDEIKKLISEIILWKLINKAYRDGKKGLEFYCVIDEAHRMLYDDSPVEKLMREARKYGIGLLLASQNIDDFNDGVLSNFGAFLGMRTSLPKNIKLLSELLFREKDEIKYINEPGLGFIKFSNSNVSKKIKIERVEDNEKFKKIKDVFDEEEKKKKIEEELKEKEKIFSIKEEHTKQKLEITELNNSIDNKNLEVEILNKKIENKEIELEDERSKVDNLIDREKEKDLEIEKLNKDIEDKDTHIENQNTQIEILNKKIREQRLKLDIIPILKSKEELKNKNIKDIKKTIEDNFMGKKISNKINWKEILK